MPLTVIREFETARGTSALAQMSIEVYRRGRLYPVRRSVAVDVDISEDETEAYCFHNELDIHVFYPSDVFVP